MTAARLRRDDVFLSGYQYDFEFRGTKAHGNADALSRAPLPSVHQPQNDVDPIGLFFSPHFDHLPVTCEQIRRKTQRDPFLGHILDCVTCGYLPQEYNNTDKLKPYYHRKDEFHVYQGCLT